MPRPNQAIWDLYIKKLKSVSAKNTVARSYIFVILYESGHTPLSMNDLLDGDSKHYGDRTTIYRTVRFFEKAGIVQRRYTGWKYKIELSDEFHGHHHHITCIKCGETHATHDDNNFETELVKLAKINGYKVTDHKLEIRGICAKCQ